MTVASARAARWLAVLVTLTAVGGARADLPPPIPRSVLFGNPERTSPTLSPDGTRLAWLAPDEKDVLQVWVKPLAGGEAKPVTRDPRRGIRMYRWAWDDRTLLYLQDADGDENWHVLGVDLPSGAVRDYTPFQGVRAELVALSPEVPGRILVALNLRDRSAMDVHAVDLATGSVTLDTENPGDLDGWVAGDDLVVRGASAGLPDGGRELRVRPGRDAPWKTILHAAFGEDAQLLDLSADGQTVYYQSNVGADTTRVIARPLAAARETVLASDPRADAGEVLVDRLRHVVQAVDFPVARQSWTVLDPTVKADFAALRGVAPGDFSVQSRDRKDATWLVAFDQDRGPVRYYAWDRAARKATYLFSHRPKLEGLPLAEMKPFTVKARDGLVLQGYLTLPVGVPPKALPTVLYPHGGPWYRDTWGYDGSVQWLANRGYAVLQVNFRGSTGYGKAFVNAADRQWGRKMHDDLVDTVRWAVKEGIADPKRVAILGGSYGGYSALAGATFTPDLFRCAVPIVAPSNLFTLIRSFPAYWKPFMAQVRRRVGDPDDPRDEALLRAASPLFSADRIRIPILLGQGANDPRVKQAEAEQIVSAIEKNGGRVTYVLYPDEGHGFQRPENRTDFFARAEAFLGQCLGGRVEPLGGDRIPGSTAVVREVGAKK